MSCSGVLGTGNVSDFVFSAASLSQVSLIHLFECKPKNNSCASPPPAASCFLSNSSSPWFISPPAPLFNLRLDHRLSTTVLLFTKPAPPAPLPRLNILAKHQTTPVQVYFVITNNTSQCWSSGQRAGLSTQTKGSNPLEQNAKRLWEISERCHGPLWATRARWPRARSPLCVCVSLKSKHSSKEKKIGNTLKLITNMFPTNF